MANTHTHACLPAHHSFVTCFKNEKQKSRENIYSYHCRRIADTAQDLPAKQKDKKILKTHKTQEEEAKTGREREREKGYLETKKKRERNRSQDTDSGK